MASSRLRDRVLLLRYEELRVSLWCAYDTPKCREPLEEKFDDEPKETIHRQRKRAIERWLTPSPALRRTQFGTQHEARLAPPLRREAGIDRGECLDLLCQHVSLPFELPDFGVQSSHLAWSMRRAGEVVFVLEGTVLDIDFRLHMVQLLFRLGEFGRRGLLAPLEGGFGNTPLLILLDEPRRLAVHSLDIPGERGVVLARLFLRLPGTGEQRLDVLFLSGIGGAFTRDVGAPRIPCPSPNNATDPGANGGPTSTANECTDPRPDRGSCPGPDQGAFRGRALRV